MTDVIEEYAARKAEALAKEAAKEAARKAEKEAVKKAEEKEQANRIELAQGLLADGMSIEFTVRHSKLTEAEVRELASKLSA